MKKLIKTYGLEKAYNPILSLVKAYKNIWSLGKANKNIWSLGKAYKNKECINQIREGSFCFKKGKFLCRGILMHIYNYNVFKINGNFTILS